MSLSETKCVLSDKLNFIQLIHNNFQHCLVVMHKIENNALTFSVYSFSLNPSNSSSSVFEFNSENYSEG